MLNQKQKFGKEAELLAVDYLKNQNYEIIETNYRTKFGEIDIIAFDKITNSLVFIEVKARRSLNPKEAVDLKKQKKISQLALAYLKTCNQANLKALKIRFDVVAMFFKNKLYDIRLIRNAFEFCE